jgi:DNA-binding response OmpR family regulator
MTRPNNILLVDDHENARLTLAALLEDEGYTVDEAGNLREARARLALAAPYVAILLDAHLGNDEYGTQLVPEARGHSAEAIIIVVTGDEALIVDGATGADAVIDKSVGVDPIIDKIKSWSASWGA